MITRSPFFTSRALSAFASRETSLNNSPYVTLASSFGSSPSQISATSFSFLGKWRSTQLKQAFKTPSSYHLIDTSPSKLVFLMIVGCLNQSILFDCTAQNTSGCSIEPLYIDSYFSSVIPIPLRISPDGG